MHLPPEIERRFGANVAQIVEGFSDTIETPEPPWRPCKQAYLAQPGERLTLRAARLTRRHAPQRAGDSLYDYRAHGDSVWSRFGGRKEGTVWYHGELARAFQKLYPGPLADEYLRTVEQMRKAAGGRLR